ncbi:MAG: hypothetical protein ACJA1R_001017 [Flavobacteriales bacterium]|jgi:hypothetical protein
MKEASMFTKFDARAPGALLLVAGLAGGLALSGCGDDAESPSTGADAGVDTGGVDGSGMGMDGITGLSAEDPQLAGNGDFTPSAESPAAMGGTPGAAFDASATYYGAVAPGGQNWLEGWTSFDGPGGIAGDETTTSTFTGQEGCDAVFGYRVICDDIDADVTWDAGDPILLTGLTFVTGGTLTIDAGVSVHGDVGAALVISSTAMIDAQGTAADPIVFTTSNGEAATPGDFGGLVLLGNATINVGSANIEGMESSDSSSYGGNDDTHNCGTIRYARIEYAGSVFGQDNELNGLTVGGCGSDTTLDYIQVDNGLDDGIEFFGGTANLTHAVISSSGDDGLDWDEGYRGNIQWLVITNSDDNGIEADNLGDDNDATPRSNPTIWNMTIVGNSGMRGMNLRRGTGADLNNVIITDCGTEPFDIRDEATAAQISSGGLTMEYVMAFGNAGFSDESGTDDEGESLDDDGGFDEAAWFVAAEM